MVTEKHEVSIRSEAGCSLQFKHLNYSMNTLQNG